jgi:putative autotransporter adhesin-like protein
MIRTLRWIAAVGLSVGVISLVIAYALDRPNIDRLLSRGAFLAHSCGDGSAKASDTERRLAWTGDAIDIALPATVRYRAGDGSDIVVRGAPDAISHVELRGGLLTLNCRWHSALRDVEVILPGRPLSRLGISGAGRVAMEKLAQPDLRISISGSGSITAQGAVDNLVLTISGAGKARLGEVAAQNLTVEVSGSGNVEASPTDEADIRISGAGRVQLLTRPARLNSKISGSGRITQPPLEAQGKK